MKRISDLNGRKIYSDSQYTGKAQDILLDPDTGEIKYIIKGKPSSILRKKKNEAKKYIKDNFIPFEKVEAVKDIIIVEGWKG